MVFTGIAGDIPERKFARVADSERFPALLKESGGEPARRGSGGLGTVRHVTVAGVAGVGSELSRTYVLDVGVVFVGWRRLAGTTERV